MALEQEAVGPHETLFVTARKRFVPIYQANEAGVRELVLHVGTQEICFDEPELFPWAEKLIEQDSFPAGSATGWASQPLEWPRIQGLLEALIEAGILAREPVSAVLPQAATSQAHLAFLERDAARKAVDGPRSWNPDPGAVLRELVGRDLPLGYIETAVPVHRIAHAVIDREGRQVGEINAYPETLRLKIPTEWKTCGYAGSRYRSEMPMNMTALRSMIAHWKPVLAAAQLFREEFLKRYPRLPDGRWKLGEVHFVATGMLGLVAWQTMRYRDPVKNGDLDPVLSSLFRVIDGVRMIAAYLLDLEPRRMIHDTPVGPRDITQGAEREGQFLTSRGVCAGPLAMIEELVDTVMNGKPAERVALGSWTADIPQALAYALLGVQLQSALGVVNVRMSLATARIREVLERVPSPAGRLGRFKQAIERDWERILTTNGHLQQQRDFSEALFQRAFDNARRGLGGPAGQRQELAVLLETPPELLGQRAAAALRDLFASAEEPAFAGAHAQALQEIAGHVMDYLRFERHALRTVVAVQRDINALLGRPQPKTSFTGMQLAIAHALRRETPGKGVFSLIETVRETLEIAIENEEEATLAVLGQRSLVLH